jgi:uncharacterized protein YbjT (DUF2867 family)
MKVILFGATGMVGQGVLRECLLDPGVTEVLCIGRSATGKSDPKLRELVLKDLTDYSGVAGELAGYDACFFCLGVTSAGMAEADYRKITVDIAAAAARTLVVQSPGLTFIYVSGAGSDSTGTSRTMWARVKGEGENAILGTPFKGKYVFRPAFIRPLHGITSRTRAYRVLYALFRPLVPLIVALFPKHVTTTERVGRAMLAVARGGHPKAILENADIDAVGASALAALTSSAA